MNSVPNILYFAPAIGGGMAEYAFYQGEALENLGANVTCLVAPGFLNERHTAFVKVTGLPRPASKTGSLLGRKFKMIWKLLATQLMLAFQIWKRRPNLVLLDSYMEYLAPLWVWPHLILARLFDVRYAANLHDPVRSHRLGPAWWHQLSVKMAYWPLDFVLVHDRLSEPSPVPDRVRVVQVPHGLFEIRGKMFDRNAVRSQWGIKADQKVFLAFGFVRDGKNLDLVIQALAQVPSAVLVVAGAVAAGKDKPFAYYKDLAHQLEVAERCRFFEGFVPDDELGKYFSGTDFVLLTYAASFHSQSGVLNVAARARKPVLASASPSALIESVKKFHLGLAIVPDSRDAVIEGMRQLLVSPPQPNWQDYEAASAWSENARAVLVAANLKLAVSRVEIKAA